MTLASDREKARDWRWRFESLMIGEHDGAALVRFAKELEDGIATLLATERAVALELAAKVVDAWEEDCVYVTGATLGDNIRALIDSPETPAPSETQERP